jgi:hypothetical protein
MMNERRRPPIKHCYWGQTLLLTYTILKNHQSKWRNSTSSWVRGNVGHNMSAEGKADHFFNSLGVMHDELVMVGQTVASAFYIKVLNCFRDAIWQKRGEKLRNN